jgi:hypothetical protein
MPFNTQTRNQLARFVTDARELIAVEFAQQLVTIYGVSASGEITPLEDLKHLDEQHRAVAELLRERIEYLKTSSSHEKNPAASAIHRFTREQAFTVLNRLAALRMAEKRDIIIESVGHGYQSKGFLVYSQVAGSGLGDTYHRYRRYLFSLFDELALDLGVLFDRRSPTGLLFPREPALLELFRLLNAKEIDALWVEDETVGWIYQFYNDETERRRMREASAAPRDSRELAVRNQFFTPRYVVEFLTDNTLGRLWYEMTRGKTSLKERCSYLVSRPSEVFLDPDQDAPPESNTDGLSQAEILRLPAYIPHRSMKDPREIRLLDPACGSMHFGLYAFDLLEVIYNEAWDLSECGDVKPNTSLNPLQEAYNSKEAFLREVPKLIIEHNIHGIDIDPRAVQIAGLSLWLCAQKSWQARKVSLRDRPTIERTNIVCAEAMPGSSELLTDFTAKLRPPILGQFVAKVFEKMQLAGEAGALLKIEDEVVTLVHAAKLQWQRGPLAEQTLLFAETAKPREENFRFDQAGITDEQFWETAEQRIYEALSDYAEETGGGYSHRLFAEDAGHGFAFIDVCRRRFDTILMNPPFGDSATAASGYIAAHFPRTKNDVYAAFIEEGINRLAAGGSIGAITSRTGFFLSSFQKWREEILLKQAHPLVVVDLGHGVLDAMVETAAYVLQLARFDKEPVHSQTAYTAFIRLLNEDDKETALSTALNSLSNGHYEEGRLFLTTTRSFAHIPSSPFAYWVGDKVIRLFQSFPPLESNGRRVERGLFTGDDFRFLRLFWEPDSGDAYNGRWGMLSKGGAFARYYADVHLCVLCHQAFAEIRAAIVAKYPYLKGNADWVLHPECSYGRPGLTYPLRTSSDFSVRCLPAGCFWTNKGISIFESASEEIDRELLFIMLAVLNSEALRGFLALRMGAGDAAARSYEEGIVARMPWPTLNSADTEMALSWAKQAYALTWSNDHVREASHAFVLPAALVVDGTSLAERTSAWADRVQAGERSLTTIQSQIDELAFKVYGLDMKAREALAISVMQGSEETPGEPEESNDKTAPPEYIDANSFAADMLSYVYGCAFGRWDIRYATGEKQEPEKADPFAALPICPLGVLQNEQGLPLTKDEVNRLKAASKWRYDVDIPWDGIIVDDPSDPRDVEARVRHVLEIIWHERSEAIEQEVCRILNSRSLREYFRRPSGFFADHLKRYSKSRRQAPIYWPLSSRSGSYTLWLYYQRLSTQTLHSCLVDFIDPKLKGVSADIQVIRGGNGSHASLEGLLDLEQELKEMRSEIEQVIKLPYQPNLNDGVLISACPLWKSFRLPKWQRDLKTCWEELERGEHDWAHLAYSIWPDRIREKCRTDLSLAISHSLENLCEVELGKSGAKRSRKQKAAVEVEGGLT